MTVHAAYVHLLSVDIKSVAGSCLYCAETEFVLFNVHCLAVFVNQRKADIIAVWCFCCPQLRILHAERNVGFVASCSDGCGVFSHFLTAHVADCGLHLCSFERVAKQHIGIECAVGFGIYGRALNVDGGLAHNEHRAKYASEVPVVGTALGKIHAGVGALLAHRNLKQIFLLAEEHAVAHIISYSIECSLMHRTSLSLVDLYLGVGH